MRWSAARSPVARYRLIRIVPTDLTVPSNTSLPTDLASIVRSAHFGETCAPQTVKSSAVGRARLDRDRQLLAGAGAVRHRVPAARADPVAAELPEHEPRGLPAAVSGLDRRQPFAVVRNVGLGLLPCGGSGEHAGGDCQKMAELHRERVALSPAGQRRARSVEPVRRHHHQLREQHHQEHDRGTAAIMNGMTPLGDRVHAASCRRRPPC